MIRRQTKLSLKTGAGIATVFLLALVAGCSGGPYPSVPTGRDGTPPLDPSASPVGGTITLDGSTTVFPIAQAMAEDFCAENPNCEMTVNKAGTGSGFQKFIRGESDVCDASRPIEAKELADLNEAGIQFLEIPIAYDGVSVIVNPQNTWVDRLTVDELKRAWRSSSSVVYWSDIRPTFPHEKVAFYGPTDNHGTYEYFTEAIDGRNGDIRADCQKDQDYNTIVQGVAGDKDAIGYIGFNYYEQNRDLVKIAPIDAGQGPVVPSGYTIAQGTYTPLARPLFFYVSKRSYDEKPQVRAFIRFVLSDQGENDVREASYVVLPSEVHAAIENRLEREQSGSAFQGVRPGSKLADLYSHEKRQ